MDDELDKILREEFKKDMINPEFHNEVNSILEKLFLKKRRKQKIIAIATPIALAATTVFAVGYSTFNLSSVGLDDKCIEMAVQNGYICTVNTEMQEYENIGIGIKDFLIDDINMEVSFEFIVSQERQKNLKNIYIQDLQISDENENQIFNENDNANISLTSGYSKIKRENEVLTSTFFAQSDNFPQSKKIYIHFNSIILNYKDKSDLINGKWNFEIEVPEKMVNRNNIEYIPISNNENGNISIKSVKLANTGLIVNAVSDNSQTLDKAKIELKINNKSLKYNNNVFEKNYKNRSQEIEYIYTFNVQKEKAPQQITLKIKEKGKEREIIFIKNE